jgi:hypothetical protein
MVQIYSDGVDVAAGGTYPLNNVVFLKGNSAVVAGAGGVALTKRGIYLVHVDGFATLADAGDYSIQLTRNGVPLAQAISTTTLAAAGSASGAFETLIVVEESDCPCNWTSAAVTVGVINPSEVDVTEAHINIVVSKLI